MDSTLWGAFRMRAVPRLLLAIFVLVSGSILFGASGTTTASSHWLPHEPIFIFQDADFTPENGVTGGTGSPDDPYVIEGWRIEPSSVHGIEIRETTAHFVIRDVLITGPTGWDGVLMAQVTNGRIENATITDCSAGIRIEESEDVIVWATILANHTWGVIGGLSAGLTVGNNTITNSFTGIEFEAVTDVRVEGNDMDGGGIRLHGSSGVVRGNRVSDTGDGLAALESADVLVEDNELRDNRFSGLWAFFTTNLTARRNAASGNGHAGFQLDSVVESTLEDNNVSVNLGHGIALATSARVRVLRNNASGNGEIGILDSSSRYTEIVGNEVHANGQNGIHAGSPFALIEDNNASGNAYGINVVSTWNNTVHSNRVWANADGGFRIAATLDTNVTDNVAERNDGPGILLDGSYRTFLRFNALRENAVGIAVGFGSDNRVHRNEFLNNTVQAFESDPGRTAWNDTYPGGGNFWSDYASADLCSGPSQDVCPDPDGFGDVPYAIDEAGLDAYPLVGPVNRTNTHPVARFVVVPALGGPGTVFHTDAFNSSDAEDPPDALEVRWDWDGDWHFDTPWSTNRTADHTYPGGEVVLILRLMVRDSGGLLAVAEQTILFDGSPPVTTASLEGTLGDAGWYRSPVDVILQATDEGIGAEETFYRVDRSAWQVYVEPFRVSQEGMTLVEFFSVDRLGNEESVRQLEVGVDTLPPAIEATPDGTLGREGWYRSVVSVVLAASDATSGARTASYRINGEAWLPYAGAIVVSADGIHRVEFYSTDLAGNSGAVEGLDIRIDRTEPALTLVAPGPGSETVVTQSSFDVVWTVSDEGSGPEACALSLDEGPDVPLTGTSHRVSSLADGSHVVAITCEDVAGNRATSRATFRVDTFWLSLSGPYGPWALVGIVVAAAGAAAGAALWIRRRRKGRSNGP